MCQNFHVCLFVDSSVQKVWRDKALCSHEGPPMMGPLPISLPSHTRDSYGSGMGEHGNGGPIIGGP